MTLLSTHALTAGYGDFQALFGVDFEIAEGEVVAMIGSNGAGKSTFLRAVTGLLAAEPDRVRLAGRSIGGMAANDIVKLGIAMVPEGRKLFPSLSVEENLRIGAYGGRAGAWSVERIFKLFPILKERRRNPGTALSGGQQQMVAIGRALMANPRLLLCDEISLGLAPIAVRELYAGLAQVIAEGTAVVVVEQDINQALAVSSRVYCLRKGLVSLTGAPDALNRADIKTAYFGV